MRLTVAVLLDAGHQERFQIRIDSSDEGIRVRECGGRLPHAGCPTRHINSDGTLCLGIAPRGTRRIPDDVAARDWWASLEEHLRLQAVADILREWNPSREVSHGEAGDFQIKAELLALKLDLLTEYREGIEKGEGPFGAALPRLKETSGRAPKLVNQRAKCLCGKIDRKGKTHLRRECPTQKEVAELVNLERRRRKAEKEFWKSWKREGRQCCGTMQNCPLKVI